jgi:hypothetical protein
MMWRMSFTDPTPDELRAQSDLLEAKWPDDNGGPHDAKIAARAQGAEVSIGMLTGRLLGPLTSTPPELPFDLVAVPAELGPLATRAVALWLEQDLTAGTVENVEATAGGKRLRSISAGPWSESYFAPGEFNRRGATGRPLMSDDPRLDEALWALATEDARAQFVAYATGVQAPGAGVVEFDYRKMGGNLRPGTGIISPRVGPDGW